MHELCIDDEYRQIGKRATILIISIICLNSMKKLNEHFRYKHQSKHFFRPIIINANRNLLSFAL